MIFGVLLLLMLNVGVSYGQGLACGGQDPDAVCPLDTWVVVLAGISLLFAAVHLYRKQKHIPL